MYEITNHLFLVSSVFLAGLICRNEQKMIQIKLKISLRSSISETHLKRKKERRAKRKWDHLSGLWKRHSRSWRKGLNGFPRWDQNRNRKPTIDMFLKSQTPNFWPTKNTIFLSWAKEALFFIPMIILQQNLDRRSR